MSLAAVQLLRPGDLAYREIKRRIVLNDLQPGQALTELGLARELGCSQGPVREALLRLQEDGLVNRSGRRGTMVTGLDAEEAAEILALRRRIETRAAGRAVAADDPARIATILSIRREMDAVAARNDAYGLIEIDTAFHLEIFRLSGLHALEQILIRCMLHSHRSRLFAPGHRRPLPETAARHDVLIERLLARDGKGLSNALGEHIDTIVDAPSAGEDDD